MPGTNTRFKDRFHGLLCLKISKNQTKLAQTSYIGLLVSMVLKVRKDKSVLVAN